MTNNIQDWKQVVWKKKDTNIKKDKFQHIDPLAIKLNKIDNTTIEDNLNIITIAKDDSNIIAKLRTDKKIKQEDLATALNIKKDIIRDIEKGIYPENKVLINKIKNYLLKYKIDNK